MFLCALIKGSESTLAHSVGTVLLAVGSVFIIIATLFEFLFRLRMAFVVRAKGAFSRGGSLNYRMYRVAAKERGWAEWPVKVMWGFVGFGLALCAVGLFAVNR